VTAVRAKPTISLAVRLSPEIKNATEEAAKARDQTLRDYVESVLKEATEQSAETKPKVLRKVCDV
jgi:hypothetical protein